MYILGIETTGPRCSVAIINEKGEVWEIASDEAMNHLRELTPMVSKILKDCQLQLGDMSAIAVSRGPGSFTGIRIGVSTARALCQGAGLPAIGVPTLKSFAYHMEDYSGVIAPMFDARRNQIYGGAYVWKSAGEESEQSDKGIQVIGAAKAETGVLISEDGYDKKIRELVPGGAYDLPEYLVLLSEAAERAGIKEITFLGDGCKAYGQEALKFMEDKGFRVELSGEVQKASSTVKLALGLFREGKLLEFGELRPDYMRKAEAERKLEEGNKYRGNQ